MGWVGLTPVGHRGVGKQKTIPDHPNSICCLDSQKWTLWVGLGFLGEGVGVSLEGTSPKRALKARVRIRKPALWCSRLSCHLGHTGKVQQLLHF